MGLGDYYNYGQTLLDNDERSGLLIKSITTKEELNLFEQHNVENGILWLSGKKVTSKEIFDRSFICQLHSKMFGSVWRWAGNIRTSNKNIGIDYWLISNELQKLCDDVLFWLDNKIYKGDELAIRFKHRLVAIHCFPNGNGRHSRLMADFICTEIFQKPYFTWGGKSDTRPEQKRSQYISALKEADNGDISALLSFART